MINAVVIAHTAYQAGGVINAQMHVQIIVSFVTNFWDCATFVHLGGLERNARRHVRPTVIMTAVVEYVINVKMVGGGMTVNTNVMNTV